MLKRSLRYKEKAMFIKFDIEGKTSICEWEVADCDASFRKVVKVKPHKLEKDSHFIDSQFPLEPEDISKIDLKRKIIAMRLYDLYRHCSKNDRPQFFPKKLFNWNLVKHQMTLPSLFSQMGLYPDKHYRSLFITQDFQQNGLYEVCVNYLGKWEIEHVDDYIPVYADTIEPIWGTSLEFAWQIILFKVYAKVHGGYSKLRNLPAFDFLEKFTSGFWKFYNLSRDYQFFFEKYKSDLESCRILLKTKNSQKVLDSGLIPNSAGYELMNVEKMDFESLNKKGETIIEKKWVATVRSPLMNQWAGSLSVLDKKLNKIYENGKYSLVLERDFMMREQDFTNLFSFAYIGSIRDDDYTYTNYKVFKDKAEELNEHHLAFDLEKDGWLEFSIKQPEENKIDPKSQKSRLRLKQENEAAGREKNPGRYLHLKFILTREIRDEAKEREINDKWEGYQFPSFVVHEIQYLHGYNSGETRFEKMIAGRYYLQFKSNERSPKPSTFVCSWSANQLVKITDRLLTPPEESVLLRQSMASLIPEVKSYSLSDQKKYESICFAELFEEIGYGFVGVRIKKACPYRLLIEFDPEEVYNSGYTLANQFQFEKKPFSVIVCPGESTSVIMEKVDIYKKSKWPPSGVKVFREK